MQLHLSTLSWQPYPRSECGIVRQYQNGLKYPSPRRIQIIFVRLETNTCSRSESLRGQDPELGGGTSSAKFDMMVVTIKINCESPIETAFVLAETVEISAQKADQDRSNISLR
jgi:hypothetical protein